MLPIIPYIRLYISTYKNTRGMPRYMRKALRKIHRYYVWQLFIYKFDRKYKDNYPF